MKNDRDLADAAYERIIGLIADGALKSGAIVSHRQLAETLQMSKQPVGMALLLLEHEGIVTSHARIGTVVNQVTVEDMWGMLQWRLAIECRAAALACERITPEESGILTALGRELDTAITMGIPKPSLELDRNFHLRIAELSGCARLVSELRKLNLFYLKSRLCDALKLITDETAGRACPIWHVEVAAAIRPGNGREAAEILAHHLEASPDMRAFAAAYRKTGNLTETP